MWLGATSHPLCSDATSVSHTQTCQDHGHHLFDEPEYQDGVPFSLLRSSLSLDALKFLGHNDELLLAILLAQRCGFIDITTGAHGKIFQSSNLLDIRNPPYAISPYTGYIIS